MVTSHRLRVAAISAAAIVALTLLAGAVAARIYDGPTLLMLLAVGVTVAVGISLGLRRATLTTAVAGQILGLLVFLVVATAVTRDASEVNGSVIDVLTDALRNSGARILTSTIPILAAPDTVVLPIMVCWLAAAVGTELAVRGKRMAAALAPPALAYGAALVLVGPNAKVNYGSALMFVAVAAFALAATGTFDLAGTLSNLPGKARHRYRSRRFVLVAAALALLVGFTTTVGPWVADWSDQKPEDPRRHIPAPQQRLGETNPLARLSGWAKNPSEELFRVTTDTPERIGWVVLSDFNGLTWTPGTTYRSAGSVLPIAEPARDHTAITQQYDLTGLDGVWLPAVRDAAEVNGVRVSYDETSGTLLLPEGVANASYTVTSHRPNHAVSSLVSASAGNSNRLDSYRETPKVPAELRELAVEVASGAGAGYQQALLLENYLKSEYVFAADAPAGHAYPNLTFFLNAPKDRGGHRGTSEQFASAFAVMARVIGLPSRVVVGFHAGTSTGDGEYTVRSGDAYAWPEVYFENFGWVPFDPTPTPSDAPPPPEADTAEAKELQQQKAAELDRLDDPPPPQPSGSEATGPAPDGANPWLAVVVAIGLAAVLIPGSIVLARWRQRRSLRSGDPTARILGAWRGVLLSMRQAGRPVPASADVAAVLATAGAPARGQPLPPLSDLGDSVNAAVFAGAFPTQLGPPEQVAGAANSQAATYVRALRRAQPWWRRILWPLDPRPLWWHRK